MANKDETGGEGAPKKSRTKLVILLAAVVLLLGGAGGYFFMFAGSGDEAEAAPEAGEVVAMEAVTVNLADGHFLKVAIALQATADAEHEPEGSKALDLTIDHFSNRKMAELSSAEGRQKAKQELIEKVGEAYHGEVMDVYFTQFVMQ